ncbi:glycoside hydrolase family 61 protein [Xylaria bambusicola]|uniref:glycoside hydrolase family 61 protein n=1 Tax=Xylaria bambusicola TaxID=326684 RepID=UPI002008357E|nr:glycoside hydrolase family 61 protein [Xylaria bambusicola]KAI0506659.1 glycoside hydrolase family 61 protein [Xylaria bambusicola]
MSLMLSLVSFLLFVNHVVAHGGLTNYTVGDTWYRGYNPDDPRESQEGQPWMTQRLWASIDPIFFINDTGLACNTPGTAPPSYIPIAAGETLTAVYWYWLHPVGPMTVWLAECGESCQDVDVNKLDFFKIWEAGILEGGLVGGQWYQTKFQHWDGSPDLWPVTIPSTLKPGLYIVRHEILSLHVASAPQFYPECAHLNISGTGNAFPSERYMARFPGAYAEDDPSIFIDIYSDENKDATNYTIAGPPVWNGFVNKYCLEC